ncbi:ABC transporter permease [Kitasatospora sp. NBC_01266]|uniref:ABC transporter permease n=1 Tax=Kitasatospora sp. NBC_01266 TaxID=2903572 RepID=UPI002E346C58|nr:ABC transporter permease [Kitasatospora sp. NBC_01266]
MNSSDLADRWTPYGVAARMSVRSYRSYVSNAVLGWSVLPRALLQAIFLVLLGGLQDGAAGQRYAALGGIAFALIPALVTKLPDVAAEEKYFGTLARLRMGRLGLFRLFLVRSLPYLAEAFGSWLVAFLVVPPLIGDARLLTRFPQALAGALVVALAGLSVGLLVTALSLGKRADLLGGNLASYAFLLLGGVLPTGAAPEWLRILADLVPYGAAVSCFRQAVAGRVDIPAAGHAVILSGCWLLAAALILQYQERRFRRTGHDDFV